MNGKAIALTPRWLERSYGAMLDAAERLAGGHHFLQVD